MKKNYTQLLALLCLLFCFSVTHAQKKLWGTINGAVYYINLDGTGFVKALEGDDDMFGSWPQGITQIRDSSIIGINDNGGPESGGTLFKISSTGISRLKYWDYPGAEYVVQGNDERLYGIGIGGLENQGFSFSVNQNGTSYIETHFTLGGFDPKGGLIKASNGRIYGLSQGDVGTRGFVYRIDSAGVTLVRYLSTAVGKRPNAKFIELGGYLYAPATEGGSLAHGTIFKMSIDGASLVNVHNFNGANGAEPFGEIAIDGAGKFYGITKSGGLYNKGVIYKMNSDGTSFTVLHHFNGESGGGYLAQDGGVLYGHGYNGDFLGGFLYSMNTDGTGYSRIYNFPITTLGNMPFDRVLVINSPPFPAVSLITPGNGATGVATSGTFTANGISHALSYQLQLSTTAAFTSIAFTFNSTTNNFAVSGLSAGTTYYARVKTNVLPGYGSTTSFTTGGSSASKLWGVLTGYPSKLYNINIDGTGYTHYYEPVIDDINGSDIQNLYKLNDGSILVDTYQGGTIGEGTLLRINASGITKLQDWSSYPFGRKVWVAEGTDGFVYGVSISATENSGRAFKIRPDGTGFVQHLFTRYGFWPQGNLLKASNAKIYGMSSGNGPGWIYTLNADLSNVTPIFNFSTATGKKPEGGLIEIGGFLYGLVREGGAFNRGTLFKIKLDATGFVKLHDFNTPLGAYPKGDLVYDGINILYGTTSAGGTFNLGTIFKINKDGTGFSVIHNFSTATGINPEGHLVLKDNILYGQVLGGTFNKGVLFSVHTDGSSYTKLREFTPSDDYYGPTGNLILTEGSLPSARAYVAEEKESITSEVEGVADIFPNPFNNDFTVMVKSAQSEAVAFNVTNIQSQQLQRIDGVTNRQYQLGESLSSGLYVLKVVRGNNVKYYRVLKK